VTLAHRILVVDDEPPIRRLFRNTLERADYDVELAADAREAMRMVGIFKPDAILLDLGLPDRDGLELVPLIRAQSDAALLIVSAREAIAEKVAALDLGADDYVTKPFDTDELLARLRTGLRRRVQASAESRLVAAWDVDIDLLNRLVRKSGEEVHLTPKVCLPRRARPPSGPRLHPQAIAEFGLGPGVRAEYRICEDRRPQPAPQARGRPGQPQAHRQRTWHRLPLEGRGRLGCIDIQLLKPLPPGRGSALATLESA
jgi:two-component system, OmpR family, KDP operon response regulator KdpE